MIDFYGGCFKIIFLTVFPKLFKRSAHSAVAAKVDAIKEFKFERPVHEGGPARQLGSPKPDQKANFEAKSWPKRPTWRTKVGSGGQLGGQNPT